MNSDSVDSVGCHELPCVHFCWCQFCVVFLLLISASSVLLDILHWLLLWHLRLTGYWSPSGLQREDGRMSSATNWHRCVFFQIQNSTKQVLIGGSCCGCGTGGSSTLCLVWKIEKLIKKQTYTKAEACKLYSSIFWIFLLNVIKVDPYSSELYSFKVCAFFLRHSVVVVAVAIADTFLPLLMEWH